MVSVVVTLIKNVNSAGVAIYVFYMGKHTIAPDMPEQMARSIPNFIIG
jgi:hypothetical protein